MWSEKTYCLQSQGPVFIFSIMMWLPINFQEPLLESQDFYIWYFAQLAAYDNFQIINNFLEFRAQS